MRRKTSRKVFGVGYSSEGNYKVKENGIHTIQYQYWHHMLERCYSKKFLDKRPTYKGCEVCEEWLDFQIFARWFDDNYYEVEDERIQLDKDIINKNNKLYSPDNCIFVPNRINVLFTKANSKRGEYPIGVTYMPKINKFQSQCAMLNDEGKRKNKYLGVYFTDIEAFEKYKIFKEAYIKEIAEKYVGKIPFKLYEAMYRYVVEIDD